MAEIAPDHLVHMDRRNNVINLSQGEFVAFTNLEAVYASATLSNAVALQLVSAVRAAKIGADQDVPHLTKDFIAKYVSDVQLLDVLTS